MKYRLRYRRPYGWYFIGTTSFLFSPFPTAASALNWLSYRIVDRKLGAL